MGNKTVSIKTSVLVTISGHNTSAQKFIIVGDQEIPVTNINKKFQDLLDTKENVTVKWMFNDELYDIDGWEDIDQIIGFCRTKNINQAHLRVYKNSDL